MDVDYYEWEELCFGDTVTRDEDAEIYKIAYGSPLESWSWCKDNKFFGIRKKGPHGWHAHPRRERLTARRKPQAREIKRQYREFGKNICKEAWRSDAASQSRRLLLEIRPDLKPKWRVVESDDEPLSELKRKIELEKVIELVTSY